MFKPILLLSIVASLSACETISQANQCDPEKNYEYTNIELMEKYKTDYANNEIKSIYYETLPAEYCNDNLCISYTGKYFDFIEKNFDDNLRNGIYTIKVINKNYQDKQCLPENTAFFNTKDKKCFVAEKNDNNKVKSKYKYQFYNDIANKNTIIEFKDIENNEVLYKVSYQIYSTGAIGGPSFSYCKGRKNNPLYKYNALSFPYNNGENR
jgi:hypothetical protein